MDVKTKETYSEVYSILNILGESYIKRIPTKLYQIIKEEKSNEYNPKYDSTIALEQQNIKKESLSMIALFHLNYWCDSKEEKQKLRTLLKNNEEKHQEELREKYNPNNVFKKYSITTEEKNTNEIVAMVEYKEGIFKKVFNKIKSFFKTNKDSTY